MKAFWVQIIDLDLFFRYLKERCHGNRFCEKNGKLRTSLWHSETERDNAVINSAINATISCKILVMIGTVVSAENSLMEIALREICFLKAIYVPMTDLYLIFNLSRDVAMATK